MKITMNRVYNESNMTGFFLNLESIKILFELNHVTNYKFQLFKLTKEMWLDGRKLIFIYKLLILSFVKPKSVVIIWTIEKKIKNSSIWIEFSCLEEPFNSILLLID